MLMETLDTGNLKDHLLLILEIPFHAQNISYRKEGHEYCGAFLPVYAPSPLQPDRAAESLIGAEASPDKTPQNTADSI